MDEWRRFRFVFGGPGKERTYSPWYRVRLSTCRAAAAATSARREGGDKEESVASSRPYQTKTKNDDAPGSTRKRTKSKRTFQGSEMVRRIHRGLSLHR